MSTQATGKVEVAETLTLDGLAALIQRARQGRVFPGDCPILDPEGRPLPGLLLMWRGRAVALTPARK